MQLDKERSNLEKRFYQLCSEVVAKERLELYDLDYVSGSTTLRVYIMDTKSKTAQLDDCVRVDHALSPHLESEEWVPSELVLEVSSPGVFRALKSRQHFEQVIGEQITVLLQGNVDGLPGKFKKEKRLKGRLERIEEEEIVVLIDASSINVNFSNIKKANLEPDLG